MRESYYSTHHLKMNLKIVNTTTKSCIVKIFNFLFIKKDIAHMKANGYCYFNAWLLVFVKLFKFCYQKQYKKSGFNVMALREPLSNSSFQPKFVIQCIKI